MCSTRETGFLGWKVETGQEKQSVRALKAKPSHDFKQELSLPRPIYLRDKVVRTLKPVSQETLQKNVAVL